MTQIVLATRNHHKKQELVALLQDVSVPIRTLDDFPGAPDVVEDGDTCEANAMKKAVEIARYTGLPAVADDTGLEVDALMDDLGPLRLGTRGNMLVMRTIAENCSRSFVGFRQQSAALDS